MFGLVLLTGLPGASKTLNTVKMIVEDKNHDNRPVFYNNIKLLFLDFDVCCSFQGYFYGVYKPSLKGADAVRIQKLMERVHTEQRLVELKDVPFLTQLYDAWSFDGGIKLWLDWVFKIYPESRLSSLKDYIALNPNPSVDDLKIFNLHWEKFDDPTEWFLLPRPARIVIDECQRFFPPRSVGSKVPKHISEFETFRHSGFDIFLITQDAKLLDANVRRLVINHYHFVRNVGSAIIIRYHSSKCADYSDYFDKKAAEKKTFKRDTRFYGLYHSADKHTFKFRLPPKVIFFFVCLIALIGFVIWFISVGFGFDEPIANAVPESNRQVSNSSLPAVDNSSYSIRPLSDLSLVNHPLRNMCLSISFAGSEIVRQHGIGVQQFYFNCEIDESYSIVSGDDDSDSKNDSDSNSVSLNRRILIDLIEMKEMGFGFQVTKNNLFYLTYNNQKYIILDY